MGKVPTKKTSAGRKQARPEFDEDAEWTEEYLSRFTVPNLKDVIQKLDIRVNGRLKADLIQAMIDYRSPTNEPRSATNHTAAKQPRRGNRRAAAKTKYTELSSDEEEDEEEEERKAPPPHTPARRSTVSSPQAPPPRPHRPKRKSIARKVSPTPSRRGSLASRRSLSPELLLVRDPSPPAPVKREASVDPAPLVQDGRVATEAVNGGDDAVAEAGVEELAAPENHIEPRPTVLMRPREALLDGEVAPVPENHIEPRPTVLMRPHEASDATLQPADAENYADNDDEMDEEEDELEEEYNRFFSERNMELMEGHLAMNHINATFLETRALHAEMAVDVQLITTLRHAEGVQAALLKPEGREFPVKQFAELR
ncbi:hypothetical protein BDZ89DRAFT_1064056 [Hymenopellis radicata]|nr:hypothetical protein BDZ89DRAFT_1064056 [Hymenopellis radicata]